MNDACGRVVGGNADIVNVLACFSLGAVLSGPILTLPFFLVLLAESVLVTIIQLLLLKEFCQRENHPGLYCHCGLGL